MTEIAASAERMPQIRMPRAATTYRLLLTRIKQVERFAKPFRKPRKRGQSFGNLVMWSMQYAGTDKTLISRLYEIEQRFPDRQLQDSQRTYFGPRWCWSSKSAARNAEAERIAQRFKVTYAQQYLIDLLLFRQYQIGVDGHRYGTALFDVGLVNSDASSFQYGRIAEDSLEKAEHINKEIIRVINDAFPDISLAALVDQQVTALIMTIYVTEVFKCTSRKQSLI